MSPFGRRAEGITQRRTGVCLPVLSLWRSLLEALTLGKCGLWCPPDTSFLTFLTYSPFWVAWILVLSLHTSALYLNVSCCCVVVDCFKTPSHYVSQTVLDLIVSLPSPSKGLLGLHAHISLITQGLAFGSSWALDWLVIQLFTFLLRVFLHALWSNKMCPWPFSCHKFAHACQARIFDCI